MKNALILLFVMFLVSCGDKNKNLMLLAEKIEYDVQIINYDTEAQWWVKNIEGSKRDYFLKKLTDEIRGGRLKAYDYSTDKELSRAYLDSIIESKSPLSQQINFLRFEEKWYYNKTTYEIKKLVYSITPVVKKDSITEAIFRIKLDTGELTRPESKLTERIQYDVNIINQRGGAAWWQENLEASKREIFIENVLKDVFENKIKTYDYFYQQAEGKQLKGDYYQIKTVSMNRNYPPYERYDTTIHQTLNKQLISRIRFLEEWYFREFPFGIVKIIKGICPIIERYRSDGELKGYMPMFWIFYDKGYPENIQKPDITE